MYPYKTEKWTCQYDYSNKARCGVADLCALPDGSLLVLERELSFSSTSGFSIFLGASVLGWKVYHIADPTQATDVKDYPSLQDGVWAKEIKTLLASDSDELTSYGNFEGICLGPRLSNGNLSVLLISDSGDGWSKRRLFPLVLSGLNVRTLNFEEPAGYTASIKGSNYRYLDGAPVSVALSGPGVLNSAYTNNGETVATALWAASGQTPSAGDGPLAAFTVAGDGTVTWAVATGSAVSAVVGHDSFEAYAAGTLGNAIPGWSGEEAEVVELSYSAAAGYPMDREAHTKVLSVDGDLTRTYSTSETNANQKLEMMVAVHRAPAGEPLPEPGSDCKIVLACDENGRVCLKCARPDGTQGWVALSSTPYANDDWVRVSFLFDYASNGGGRAFVQVSLDGTPCVTADGVASPASPTAGGDWYELLTVGQKRLSSVTASGMCKLDDVLYTIEAAAAAVTFADDGAAALLADGTAAKAAAIAAYIEGLTDASVARPVRVVTKPMVASWLLGANKVLNTPETEVLKITAIEQVEGDWRVTVSVALNAADQTAGASADLNAMNGVLKALATDDLSQPFTPVDSAKFTVAPVAPGSPDAIITVTDTAARFLKATVTE